jgi:hypothetical protein
MDVNPLTEVPDFGHPSNVGGVSAGVEMKTRLLRS